MGTSKLGGPLITITARVMAVVLIAIVATFLGLSRFGKERVRLDRRFPAVRADPLERPMLRAEARTGQAAAHKRRIARPSSLTTGVPGTGQCVQGASVPAERFLPTGPSGRSHIIKKLIKKYNYRAVLSIIDRMPSKELLGRAGVASEWIESKDVLLDIGCNDGLFLSQAAPRCRLAWGVDIDHELLGKASAMYPAIRFQYASADRLPFPDASFSVISMLDVLEHLPDTKAAMMEVNRVLCPGGRLIISVPHKGTFGFVDAQRSTMFAAGRRVRLGKMDEVLEHRHYVLQEVSEILGPGYKVERLRYGGFLLFPLCGFALMFTDGLGMKRASRILRVVEDKDFNIDYGTRSWHLMVEYRKAGEYQAPSPFRGSPIAASSSDALTTRDSRRAAAGKRNAPDGG
jgi:SAM-dependent methyltransferase